MLTVGTFTRCGVPAARARLHVEAASAAMREAGITSQVEARLFLSQALHETGGFHWLSEIWGPTAAQRSYVGRMGNRTLAEAYRYRGRGVFQLTGRENYIAYGRALGLNLRDHPERAAEPRTAWRIAASYWRSRVRRPGQAMPTLRDATIRINGGLNGYADRVRYWRLLGGAGVVPGPGANCEWLARSEATWKREHTIAQALLADARSRNVHPRGQLEARRDRAAGMLGRRREQRRVAGCRG